MSIEPSPIGDFMKKTSLSPAPSQSEFISGWVYLVFQLLFLGPVLSWLNSQLSKPLSAAELNFTFFGVNFLAVLLIFHDFLGRGLKQVFAHPAYFCQAVILGYVAYWACGKCVDALLPYIAPGYQNLNDTSIAQLSRGNTFLMAIGTVILVPPVEECFYRGLIFRPLFSKNRWAAYIVSMLAFAAIHVTGYLGSYSPRDLIISFLQYLPAGLCLAWAYAKSDTIFAPILIHAIINARGIGLLWQPN